jgi:hypothetical protein
MIPEMLLLCDTIDEVNEVVIKNLRHINRSKVLQNIERDTRRRIKLLDAEKKKSYRNELN